MTYSEYVKTLVNQPGDLRHSTDSDVYTFSLGRGFSTNPGSAAIAEVGEDFVVATRTVGGAPGMPRIRERIIIPLHLLVVVFDEHAEDAVAAAAAGEAPTRKRR